MNLGHKKNIARAIAGSEESIHGMHIRAKFIARLYTWVMNPTPEASDLQKILMDLRLAELLHIIVEDVQPADVITTSSGETTRTLAARIAWAELGRRLGYADLQTYMTVTDTEVSVELVGEAGAHHTPKLS